MDLTFNLKGRQDPGPTASGELTPPHRSPLGTAAQVWGNLGRSARRRNSRLSQPLPPFPAPLAGSRGSLRAPQARRRWGQGGGRGGLESAERREPGRPGPRRTSPPPPRILRGLARPSSSPPEGPRPLPPSPRRFRDKEARLQPARVAARLWGPRATTCPPPALPPPGRDAPSPLSRLRETLPPQP